jgi:hypothetical protein
MAGCLWLPRYMARQTKPGRTHLASGVSHLLQSLQEICTAGAAPGAPSQGLPSPSYSLPLSTPNPFQAARPVWRGKQVDLGFS